MTSPTKSEPDYDESEDEDSLPRDADSTGSLHELDNKFDRTTSTEDPSDFTEGTQDRLQEPPSPGTSRKRVLDEVYQKSHLPLLSTTPQKTPPKSIAFPYRSPADAQTAKTPFGRPLEHTGLSALRNVMNASSPPASTGGTAVGDETERSLHGVTEQERKPFIHGIQTFEQDLEKEFQQFEQQLEGRDRSAELAALDWNDLERRFTSDLDPLIAQEDQIRQELGQRLQQFVLWMQVSSEKEGERAIKRLRTRAAFVQNSESKLDVKQEHYRKVVEAFETAMRLLAVP